MPIAPATSSKTSFPEVLVLDEADQLYKLNVAPAIDTLVDHIEKVASTSIKFTYKGFIPSVFKYLVSFLPSSKTTQTTASMTHVVAQVEKHVDSCVDKTVRALGDISREGLKGCAKASIHAGKAVSDCSRDSSKGFWAWLTCKR